VRVERAQGPVEGRSLRIDRLQLGHLARNDVPVIVLPDDELPRSRLGQAFLDAFEVEFDGGAYTIRR
jgi:aspartyl protease family protein